MYAGVLCKFTSPTEGSTDINVYSTLNGTSLCGASHQKWQSQNPDQNSQYNPLSAYYKIIIPWELIKDEFKIN